MSKTTKTIDERIEEEQEAARERQWIENYKKYARRIAQAEKEISTE